MHDCHAEVIARRSLQKSLVKEINWIQSDQPAKAIMLEADPERPGTVKVKNGLTFEMYVSEPPCGDASLL